MKKNKPNRQPKLSKEEDLNRRVGLYVKGEHELCDRLKIERKLCINFPYRKKLPFFSKIAMKILKSQDGIVDMRFIDLTLKK